MFKQGDTPLAAHSHVFEDLLSALRLEHDGLRKHFQSVQQENVHLKSTLSMQGRTMSFERDVQLKIPPPSVAIDSLQESVCGVSNNWETSRQISPTSEASSSVDVSREVTFDTQDPRMITPTMNSNEDIEDSIPGFGHRAVNSMREKNEWHGTWFRYQTQNPAVV